MAMALATPSSWSWPAARPRNLNSRLGLLASFRMQHFPLVAASRIATTRNAATAGEVQAPVAAAAPAAEEEQAAGDPRDPSALKLQSDLLKKKQKRLELRRKRLKRKRMLRKKGRWPPSKVAKNKNI